LTSRVILPLNILANGLDSTLYYLRHCRCTDRVKGCTDIGDKPATAVKEILVKAAIVDLAFEFPDVEKNTLGGGQYIVFNAPEARRWAFSKFNETIVHFIPVTQHPVLSYSSEQMSRRSRRTKPGIQGHHAPHSNGQREGVGLKVFAHADELTE